MTDQTKITKQGAAATMAEITVGEEVSGSYWKKEDGGLEAKNVKIGAKAETETAINTRKKEPMMEASPGP